MKCKYMIGPGSKFHTKAKMFVDVGQSYTVIWLYSRIWLIRHLN